MNDIDLEIYHSWVSYTDSSIPFDLFKEALDQKGNWECPLTGWRHQVQIYAHAFKDGMKCAAAE